MGVIIFKIRLGTEIGVWIRERRFVFYVSSQSVVVCFTTYVETPCIDIFLILASSETEI